MAAQAAWSDALGSIKSQKGKQAGNEGDLGSGGGGAAGGGVYDDDGDDGLYEPVTPAPVPTSAVSSYGEEQPRDSLAGESSHDVVIVSWDCIANFCSALIVCRAGACATPDIEPPVVRNQPAQHTKVRIKRPEKPYSEEIYSEIEEEIYASANAEIQALTAQVSFTGVLNSMLERFKRSSMLESLSTKVKQVADDLRAKLASAGKPATQAEVERKLKAIVPKEVAANLSVALEDAHRENAELQQKIAKLQAMRALPSVPGKRDITAGQAGQGGDGGDADGDYWTGYDMPVNVEDVDCEVPFFLPVNTEENTGFDDDDGDDY